MAYEISQEQIDKWRHERWKKDNVAKIIKSNGFTFKPEGRCGMIYFTENGKLCEIYVEMSGVPKYDLLIFLDDLKWSLPTNQNLSDLEIDTLKENLKIWLKKKNIKGDL